MKNIVIYISILLITYTITLMLSICYLRLLVKIIISVKWIILLQIIKINHMLRILLFFNFSRTIKAQNLLLTVQVKLL